MVSPMPPTCDPPSDEPLVEQFFPREMSWYAPEGPQGAMEDISRWVREHPWPALGIALGAGIAAGILLPGLARLTGDALTTLSGAPKQTSPEKSAEQVERQS